MTIYYLLTNQINDTFTLIGSIICELILILLIYNFTIKDILRKKKIKKLFDSKQDLKEKVVVTHKEKETKKEGIILDRNKNINFTHDHYVACLNKKKEVRAFYCNEHLYKFLYEDDEIEITFRDLDNYGIALIDIK